MGRFSAVIRTPFTLLAFALLHAIAVTHALADDDPPMTEPVGEVLPDVDTPQPGSGNDRGEAENAEAEDADGLGDVSTPKLLIEPGTNLFGEPIGDREDETKEILSQRRQRVGALVKRVLELSAKETTLQHERRTTLEKLQTLRAESKQLPGQLESHVTEAAEKELRMAAMRNAGVEKWPSDSPPRVRFRRFKVELPTHYANIHRLRARFRVLSTELRRMEASLSELEQKSLKVVKESLDILLSVGEVMGPLVWIPKADANAIADRCEVTLDQFPDLHLVRLLEGFSRLHAGQTSSADELFSRILEAHVGSGEPLAGRFALMSLLGRAWVAMQSQDVRDLERAGKDLASARRLAPRDYHLAIAQAYLSEKRERYSQAFAQYRVAARLEKKTPHAYRMAALMVLEAKSRPPRTAVSLAAMACDCDEQNDWRNHFALALGQLADGATEEHEASLMLAREAADDEGLELIDDDLQKFSAP